MTARAAAMRYRHPGRDLRIIAVAGAYGKTTTSLLLGGLLQEAKVPVVTMTSQGCHFNGQPLPLRYDGGAQSLQHALAKAKQKKADVVIVELSERLLESHVLATVPIEMAIVTSDDPTAQALLRQPANYAVLPSGFEVDGLSVAPHQAISFGTDDLAEAKIATTRLLRGGTEIELVIDHQTKLELATYLVGKANVMNIAAAVAGAYVLAADIETFQEGIAKLEKVRGNFEKVAADRPYVIYSDHAVHATSVELALASAHELAKRRLLVALDGSVELGSFEAVKSLSDRLVLVGEEREERGVESVATAGEALEVIFRAAKKDDFVLLLGAEFTKVDGRGQSLVERMIEGTGE